MKYFEFVSVFILTISILLDAKEDFVVGEVVTIFSVSQQFNQFDKIEIWTLLECRCIVDNFFTNLEGGNTECSPIIFLKITVL